MHFVSISLPTKSVIYNKYIKSNGPLSIQNTVREEACCIWRHSFQYYVLMRVYKQGCRAQSNCLLSGFYGPISAVIGEDSKQLTAHTFTCEVGKTNKIRSSHSLSIKKLDHAFSISAAVPTGCLAYIHSRVTGEVSWAVFLTRISPLRRRPGSMVMHMLVWLSPWTLLWRSRLRHNIRKQDSELLRWKGSQYSQVCLWCCLSGYNRRHMIVSSQSLMFFKSRNNTT